MARGDGVLWIGLTLLFVAGCVRCVSRADLLQYGDQTGDQVLESGSDQTKEVILDQSIFFFDQKLGRVYVNTNGFVSIENPPAQSEYLGKMPATFGTISAFLGDLDTSDGVGKVYFRQENNPSILEKIAKLITQAFPDFDEVTLVHVFIVTWEKVAAHGTLERQDGIHKQRNTFQLILASTARDTYAVLLYPKDEMHYFSTRVGDKSQPVEAGFSQGEIAGWFYSKTQGPYHRIPTGAEDSVRDLPKLTNSGRQGVWVYNIGTSYFDNIVPGHVTTFTSEEIVATQDVTETLESRDRIPENPLFESVTPEKTLPEPQTTSAELILEETTSREATSPNVASDQVIQDELQPSYRQRLTVEAEPQPDIPYPRGPRPANPQVVVLEDPAEEIDVNVFSYYETCSSSRHKCSSFADCRDYTTGYCCHCKPGYYGNGKNCVAEGKPQRMNGKVNGRIYVGGSASPVELSNNDLHSYVVVNDGRAYVAISSIPPNIGHSLQPLSSLGGVIGWAFALEQPEYQNGFSIIGGVFTRQTEVTFQPGGEKLTISQEFQGIDEHDHLVVSTRLDGRVPEVPSGATVQIDPYVEIYQYASNLITSSSTREYTVSDPDGSTKTLSYIWRQRITFQGCPHDDAIRSVSPSQQLSVDQVFVMYDSTNQLIRYAMTNKIGPVSGPPQQNPCFTGRHGCDTNAVCRPGQGNQFTCQCATGFTGDGRTCQDIDECTESSRICGAHAVCNNQPGTFRCECVAGFQFAADGQTCVQVHHDINHCQTGTHDCDVPQRARCTYTGRSAYICSCLPGYVGDGRVCQDINECQTAQCHRHATCYNTDGSFTCRCNAGYYGDGFSCTPESAREKTACERERESALAGTSGGFFPRPAVGQFVVKCDPNGDYEPTQCHESIGQCWCVDRYGQEIPGTRTGPGSRPPCLDHNAVPRPIGPTPRPDVSPLAVGTNLLFAQNGKIETIPLDENDMKKEDSKTLLHLPDKVVIAVAYDCVDKMVYWTDITQPSISRASIQGGQPSTIITKDLGSPEGIAVDHLSRNMYWTDSVLDRIEVSKLDGRHRRVLFDADLVNPRAIITDPVSGRLYWSDWNRDNPKIEVSNMDGTERRILVKDGIELPNALTYDSYARQLCWADAGSHKVECINPYTQQRRKVVDGINYPFSIVYYGRNLYYTDWRREAVVSVDHVAGREADEFQPQKRARLYGITTTYPQCPQEVNYCANNNGGCSHLCLPRPGSFSCRCPSAPDASCIENDRLF